MMVCLYPKSDEYLDPKEIASRVERSFPTAIVDWARGDQLVGDALRELEARNVSDVILTSHRSLFGRTAYAKITFPESHNQYIETLIEPYSRLELKPSESLPEALLRHAAGKLADVLGYNWKIKE